VSADLKVGRPGQYEVQVDGQKVAEKSMFHGFPSESEVVEAVSKALGRAT